MLRRVLWNTQGVLARRLLRHPAVEQHISTLLRSRLVKQSWRFGIRELGGVHTTHAYRIRENGLLAVVAHRSPDVLTLDQAFHQHVYEPPAKVVEILSDVGHPLRALDLGANIGLWTLWLHGRFSVQHVTALEPDPENATKQARTIELNGLTGSWTLIEAAATTRDGPVSFTVGQATTGHIADDEDGRQSSAVDGRDVFALLDRIDLLKLDIEGAEWAILADPRFSEVSTPVVTVEHHPRLAPSPDPSAAASSALKAAGYETHAVQVEPDGTGVVWGWRP
jgi:FkbM family methyltransferase